MPWLKQGRKDLSAHNSRVHSLITGKPQGQEAETANVLHTVKSREQRVNSCLCPAQCLLFIPHRPAHEILLVTFRLSSPISINLIKKSPTSLPRPARSRQFSLRLPSQVDSRLCQGDRENWPSSRKTSGPGRGCRAFPSYCVLNSSNSNVFRGLGSRDTGGHRKTHPGEVLGQL